MSTIGTNDQLGGASSGSLAYDEHVEWEALPRPVRVGLQILRMKIHPVQLEGEVEFFEKPVDAARPRVRCEM